MGGRPRGVARTDTNSDVGQPRGVAPTDPNPDMGQPRGVAPANPDIGQPQGVAPTDTNPDMGQPRGVAPWDTNPDMGQPRGVAPTDTNPDMGQPRGVAPTEARLSLSDVVHRFKTMTTTRYISGVKTSNWPRFDRRLWQRNYYEHIVRDDDDLNRIRQYISDNPLRWEQDRENPKGEWTA